MTIMTLPLINHLFGCIVSSLPVIVSPNIFLFTKCCPSLSSYFNWSGKFLYEVWSPHWKKTKTSQNHFCAMKFTWQLKRLELKLKQFAEVETFLMKECEQVERTRQRIAAERARMISARFGSAGATSPMILPGVGPSMVNNNTSNNRQQIISASPSQPSIPGYNNNQPVHPHMPFMPRQQMFGMGPRLPMSAIQQSPTSNVMFNSSGNVQPTLNQPMLRPVSGTSSSLG